MKKVSSILALLFTTALTLQAQTDNPDFFRSIGKIYVVVAVIVVVFIGIIIFLIYLDRKLTKLEDQINENE
ncbi:MAG: CcmD family protein [Bacteroidota bacterium]